MREAEIISSVLESEARELLDYDAEKTKWSEISQAIINTQGKLILMGVGKSGLIARKIAATLASTGTPSFFIHPTEAMHGDLGMIESADMILAISYSGESSELVDVILHLKKREVKIISMARDSSSSLGRLGDFFISNSVSKEACPLNVAPMSSTTLTLALGDALAALLMQKRGFKKEDFANFHPGGKLGKRLFLKIKDFMQLDNLPFITREMSLKDAILIMSEARLGSAIVLDSKNELFGILSDGDLRRAMMRSDFSLQDKADKYANTSPKFIENADMLAYDALRFMEDSKIQLLLICKGRQVLGAVHLHTLVLAGI